MPFSLPPFEVKFVTGPRFPKRTGNGLPNKLDCNGIWGFVKVYGLGFGQEFGHFFPGDWKPRLWMAKPPFGGFLLAPRAGGSPAKAGLCPL